MVKLNKTHQIDKTGKIQELIILAALFVLPVHCWCCTKMKTKTKRLLIILFITSKRKETKKYYNY